jgi:hypothetical protein
MPRGLIYLGAAGLAAAVVTGVASSAATPQTLRSRQAIAQHLQQQRVDRFMTAPAQAALAMTAAGNRELGVHGQLVTAPSPPILRAGSSAEPG